MSKKLVVLGPAHPYRGGLSTFNERLSREFIAQGWEVELYTFTLQYPSFLFPGKTQFTDSPAPDGLTIHKKVNSIHPLNWIKVGLELRKKKPDILLTRFWIPFMGPSLGTIARIVRGNKVTKVMSILDNVIPHEKRVGDSLFTRYFVNAVDYFLAMTTSVEEDLRKFTKTKPCIVSPHPMFDNFGNPITRENALAALKLNSQYRYVLFFGFVRKYKGLDLLLKAFSDAYFADHSIKLIIAGEYYDNQAYYTTLIKDLGLEERVIAHDHFIEDTAVVNYFCGADICVQPYKTATQSGVTQIAYHFHTPMLVTNVGGLPEMVPDRKVGYVVDVDEKAIKERLIDFFENNRKKEFTDNIAVEKRKYDWSVMVDAIQRLIQ